MKKPNYPTVTATVIDEDTMRYGGSAFKRERTCHIVMYEGSPACSECYRELDYDSKFCDSCGAKVVGS